MLIGEFILTVGGIGVIIMIASYLMVYMERRRWNNGRCKCGSEWKPDDPGMCDTYYKCANGHRILMDNHLVTYD